MSTWIFSEIKSSSEQLAYYCTNLSNINGRKKLAHQRSKGFFSQLNWSMAAKSLRIPTFVCPSENIQKNRK